MSNSPGGETSQVAQLLQRGLELYRQGELLAALAEWETVLELDPDCSRAQDYIAFVTQNFDLLEEHFRLSDDGEASDSDMSFAIEAMDPASGAPLAMRGAPEPALSLPGRGEPDGWMLGESGRPHPAPAPAADAPSPRRAGSRTTLGNKKRLDPAELAGILPRPEEDDLLLLARSSQSMEEVEFDLEAIEEAPGESPQAGPSGAADYDITVEPAPAPARPGEAARSDSSPSPARPSHPRAASHPGTPPSSGNTSRPGTSPAGSRPDAAGRIPGPVGGSRRATLRGLAAPSPRDLEVGLHDIGEPEEPGEDEQTIERNSFARRPQARLRDELTPLPELPGEGALTVGASPDLDDAWTLDLGLDESSWGSPSSSPIPTSSSPPPSPGSQPIALGNPLPNPRQSATNAVESGASPPHQSEPRAAERNTDAKMCSSSFEVEALTGPETPQRAIAPIVIEEMPSFTSDPIPLEDDASGPLGAPAPARMAAASAPRDEPSSPAIAAEIGLPPPGSDGNVSDELELRLFRAQPHGAGDPDDPAAGSMPAIQTDARVTQPIRGPARARAGSARPPRAASQPPQSGTPSSYPKHSPLHGLSVSLLAELDDQAPPGENARSRLRRRVTALIERAKSEHRAGNLTIAVLALDLAVTDDPDSAITHKLVQLNRDTMCEIFQSYLGDAGGVPVMAVGLNELSGETIDNRAAFLLSRIDGMLTVDELLDVSGMPRVEAYRHLCMLALKGILKINS